MLKHFILKINGNIDYPIDACLTNGHELLMIPVYFHFLQLFSPMAFGNLPGMQTDGEIAVLWRLMRDHNIDYFDMLAVSVSGVGVNIDVWNVHRHKKSLRL